MEDNYGSNGWNIFQKIDVWVLKEDSLLFGWILLQKKDIQGRVAYSWFFD